MIRLSVLATLLLAVWPALAAECLSLPQARKAWPTAYLSYRSTPAGRCWSAGHAVSRNNSGNRATIPGIAQQLVPLPPPAPDVIRSPVEIGHAAFEPAPLSRPIKTIRITRPGD